MGDRSRDVHRLCPGVRAVAAAVAIAPLSCASIATLKTGTTVAEGRAQLAVSLDASGNNTDEVGDRVLPELGVAVRYGVTERAELRGRLGLLPLGRIATALSAELGAAYQLYSASGVHLLGMLTVGYRYATSSAAAVHLLHQQASLSLGLDLAAGHRVIVSGIGGVIEALSSGSHPVIVPNLGGSLGYRLVVHQRWALLAEGTLLFSPTGLEGTGGTLMFHAGLAALYDAPW